MHMLPYSVSGTNMCLPLSLAFSTSEHWDHKLCSLPVHALPTADDLIPSFLVC